MTRKNKLNIVTLGDLHVKAIDPDDLYEQISKIVYPQINKNINALIQLGDWFHKIIPLNSLDSQISFKILLELCEMTKELNIPFRILKGTLSHDYLQLDNYKYLENSYPNFKIINKACHEELLEGFDVLWIPEEYPENYDLYYNSFFKDEEGYDLIYDAIFGHGEIDIASSWSNLSESKYSLTPVHDYKTLIKHCSGPISFGHIHNEFVYKNKIRYPGSFTRWVFGEESPKGFHILHLKYNELNEDWDTMSTFIENNLCKKYTTITLSEIVDNSLDINLIFKKIEEYMSITDYLKIKKGEIIVNIEQLEVIKNFVKNNYMNRVIVDITANTIVKEKVIEEINKKEEEYNFLKDPNIGKPDKISRFILNERNVKISSDEILEILNAD